jgi:hypothetical protein
MEKVMQDGLDMLNHSAEEASRQARDIDAQFQARIRQNYELLSDFILRMGGVAGGRKPIDLAVNELPDPLARRRDAGESRPAPLEDEARAPLGPEKPAPEAAASEAPSPSAEDEAAPRDTGADAEDGGSDTDRPRREGGWRWRDLLATMDPEDQPPGDKPGGKPKS